MLSKTELSTAADPSHTLAFHVLPSPVDIIFCQPYLLIVPSSKALV